MQELYLCPPEATTIKLNLPDDNSLTIDAMDVEDLLSEVYVAKSTNVLADFIDLFEKKYEIRLSRYSADVLLQTKYDLIESAKKNILGMQESTDSSIPQSPSVKETSNSSSSRKRSSKRKKK
jgi:hypothetical protein